jgi:eukaryotic-like serine/threonine-protein kinase
MGLDSGTRFGPYEVVERIGAGGMGEVWRAWDTNLKRDVAVKVLPESLASDADRLARFQREAEVLASLNHPNIATIHGLEKTDGHIVIVMELIEGPTLADRIAEGPIAPDEALGLARQLADALEAAHGAQIIHRDLKPANIKLRPDGTIKVLDFGIAKSIEAQAISGGRSPVKTTPAVTETGVILGTAAYMSPEQARGKLVDQRTDIWAFGCLLFEMLTGQPAFGGEDVMLTLARVLDRDTDMSSMPGTISPAVRHTIKLCLEKDPSKRISDIRDVRLALDGAFESAFPRVRESAETLSFWRRIAPLAATAVVAVAITYVAVGSFGPVPAREIRRSIHVVPDEQRLNNPNVPAVAITPDGSEIVYAGRGALYRRRLSELEARLIPGTDGEGPIVPVFAPDGKAIVYGSLTDGQLKRVPIDGGSPLTVVPEWASMGWRWSDADTIYYAVGCAVSRVAATGGTPELLLDDDGYDCPEPTMLPGGQYLIFEQRPGGDGGRAEVAVHSLATNERTVLFPGKQPQFVDPGYLVYFDQVLGLMVRTFDPATLEYGNPVALVDDVLQTNPNGGVHFRVSSNGTLVYVRDTAPKQIGGSLLAIVDETGAIERLDLPARDYRFPSVSPRGDLLAVQVGQDASANIFVYDLSGDSEPRQLTFEGRNIRPVWTPDGEWITYVSQRDGAQRIYRQRADGSGGSEVLTDPGATRRHNAPAWAPDGRLAYTEVGGADEDIWIVSLPDGAAERLVDRDGAQIGIAFSPNGQALAYASGGPVASEIWVEPFPPDGRRVRVSEEGQFPVWSRDSERLSYMLPTGGIGTVDIDTSSFTIRNRRTLDLPGMAINGGRPMDTVPESDQFLVTLIPRDAAGNTAVPSTEIVIVENWIEEVEQRVPMD